jgi:uncharacterized protein YbjT (DUF2867 family)/ketosteroid isomerase-like protein
MTEYDKILVTGATGNTGRHVVRQLHEMGVAVRALVRDPGTAGLPAGVEVVHGDLADPDSVRRAAEGTAAAFLLWPFRTAEGAAAAVDAIASHARRIVYLSAISASDGFWGEVEQLIEQSAKEWTFLRAGGMAVNTLMWADQIRVDGIVRWPYGQAARSLIHERDIADVAVLALTQDRHVGATYLLTGPEAVTQAEQVRIISEEAGQPARWVEEAPGAARKQLIAALGDPAFVDHAMAYWASLVTQPEPVTSTVQDVTGTPARTFRDWARDHADAFRSRSAADIASRYVALFQAGDMDAAVRLMAADVVRIAPLEPGADLAGLRGWPDIMANGRRLSAGYQIHNVGIEGPFVHASQFAVRFTFDETQTATGVRGTTTKISLYTVTDGAIAREEVFYHTPPHTA